MSANGVRDPPKEKVAAIVVHHAPGIGGSFTFSNAPAVKEGLSASEKGAMKPLFSSLHRVFI
jgi:hypothetical protein